MPKWQANRTTCATYTRWVFGVRLRIGRDWTFKTSEHGGGEPDNMPQAIRATDETGRWAIYVPLTRGGKIVIPRPCSETKGEAQRPGTPRGDSAASKTPSRSCPVHRRHGSVFKRAFCQQDATRVGARATNCPGDLRQALREGQKNEAIAEAHCGRTCGLCRRRASISSTCRLATGAVAIGLPANSDNQPNRAFLIEQGIAVGSGPRALRKSLFAILENRKARSRGERPS